MRRPIVLASLVISAAAALAACTPDKPAATPNTTTVTPATPMTAPSASPAASPATSPAGGKTDDKKVDDKGKTTASPEVKKTEGNTNK